jgi:methylthioribose-1-phosphate isomerase
MLQTITWTGSAVRLLDQTKLPTQTVYVDIIDERQMWDAIHRLVVRGAPAIGVAAAFGVYLGIRPIPTQPFDQRLNEVCNYLATSRPTAVNLFWAIERIRRVAKDSPHNPKQRILDEAMAMLEEDNRVCRAIGEHGVGLLEQLPQRDGRTHLLTHCNAGGLATVQFGTALAPIYVGHERGMELHVYVDETRPLLQGSRITAFELHHNGVPTTVICDNMAATLMSQGKIAAAIVGADRIAANGDVANKIGTLGVAILARHFRIPFYVAAPTSTIDMQTLTGNQIPIEQRDAGEVTHFLGKQSAPAEIGVFNPAFDVTPAELVTALITEHGIIAPPYSTALRQLMAHDFGASAATS